MKTLFLSTLLGIGLVAAAHGQGTISLNNIGNTDTSSTATTSGMYFIQVDDSTPVQLLDYTVNPAWSHLNINLYGGPSNNIWEMTLLVSIIGTDVNFEQQTGNYAYITSANPGEGTFMDLQARDIVVPGATPGNLTWLRQEVWLGDAYTSFADAVANNAYTGDSIWQNVTGGVGTFPLTSPPERLSSMPATILMPVPEPGMFSLIGLGVGTLILARRRK